METCSCLLLRGGLGVANLAEHIVEDYISALTTKDPNKLRVYAGFKQFEITINGITHRIRDTDVVNFDGEHLAGEELYEKLQGCKPRDVLAT